ncbi:MAG: enoyl-CoA hydratase-related protein, partial [Chloroflexota bacterium]|nr:enoyl-CoA hydratase-related protein [Chloroflexota bacterium]
MAVDVEIASAVAILTLNRPEALNAFNTAQMERLLAALREIRGNDVVRCVVVSGAGDRSFAAGADIKEMAGMSQYEGLAFGRLGHAITKGLADLPQPTIAAVNGFAFGGGCELALAADIRLAADTALFAQPEVSLGIPPGWGATQRLPRLIGPGLAAELIFTGRRVDAAEALRIGLVNAVYPAAELREAALAMAGTIAAASPRANRAAKQAMATAFGSSVAAGLDSELALFAASFGTADQREGMRAFVEKRKPSFARGEPLTGQDRT